MYLSLFAYYIANFYQIYFNKLDAIEVEEVDKDAESI